MLQKGAGHLEGTSLPVGGLNTHTVITAHRGLPTANLFTDLDKVKEGDIFFIRNIKEKLAYKVKSIEIVEPTDLEKVAVREGEDYATLLTCTPYMINSHRLLVKGERIFLEESDVQEKGNIFENSLVRLFIGTLLLLSLLFSFLFYNFKTKTIPPRRVL